MPKRKPQPVFDLVGSIKGYFRLTPFQEIIPWLEKNITLVDDVSSERDSVDFSKYCYQVPILKTWQDFNRRKIVTVVSVEQIGKSTCWVYGLLYRMVFTPAQMLICYPSDSLAVENNQTKLEPLMRHIPRSKRRA